MLGTEPYHRTSNPQIAAHISQSTCTVRQLHIEDHSLAGSSHLFAFGRALRVLVVLTRLFRRQPVIFGESQTSSFVGLTFLGLHFKDKQGF